jgi:hypothetical protein
MNTRLSSCSWTLLGLAALVSYGMLGASRPALAEGTLAGSAIKNTATGVFTDDPTCIPGAVGCPTNTTTSNEVVITVAEVAGITVKAQTPSNASPRQNDSLYVDFIIENTGNDPTQFFLPGVATLSNTTNFSVNGPLKIVNTDGSTIDIAPGGTTSPSIPVGDKVKVRVPILVAGTAGTGATLKVSLGNTTSVADAQNVDRALNGTDAARDIYTVDNTGTPLPTGEITGAPTNGVNGVREAMATSPVITVDARLQAFSTVLKAVSSYTNSGTPGTLTDDVLTYKLALKVAPPTTGVPSGLAASDLYGTQLKIDSPTAGPDSYVLVSDVVPTELELAATTPTAPTTPTGGWTVVYSTDTTGNALVANWKTARPTGQRITRVGFIYKTSPVAPLTAPTPLKNGDPTIEGFLIPMNPTSTFTGGEIANIAQTFGQSQPGTPIPNTPTQIVYDESGDQTSNNGLDSNDPTAPVTPSTPGGITDGKADPTKDGKDPGTGLDPKDPATTNKGDGTDKGGEDNIFIIATMPLNGPKDKPSAIGPNSNNDDFTNKSVIIPEGTSPDAVLTDDQTKPVTFTNTVLNPSAGQQVITLLPTPPSDPLALPTGTRVTIADPLNPTITATYIYTQATGFALDPASVSTTPITITIAGGGTTTGNYTVTVDLPGGMKQFENFLVPITAFIDGNGDGKPVDGNNQPEPSNITIDRVYTNYLKLDKKARILINTGTPEAPVYNTFAPTNGSFTTDVNILDAAAQPGNIIEYQITYSNISSSGGTDNGLLPANKLVITEDGNATIGTTSNTWATITIDPDYSTVPLGTAKDSGTGVITVTPGGSPADIHKYVDTIPTVAPGGSGIFTFRRKIQ